MSLYMQNIEVGASFLKVWIFLPKSLFNIISAYYIQCQKLNWYNDVIDKYTN